MSPVRLLEHYETFSEAEDAVPRLRQFILELAVRGKIVEQNSEDEPAQIPIERGQEAESFQKTSMVESALPKGWRRVFLGRLISLRKGKKPKALNAAGRGLPYLDIAALERGDLRQFTEDAKCPRATVDDLVIVCDGSRSGLVLDGRDGVLGSTVAAIQFNGFTRGYLRVLLNALYEDLNGSKKGAAIPHLNVPRLLSLKIGLPPPAEQHRIVAKVDELMALCDELEAARTKRETRRDRLAAATLHRLNNGDASPEAANVSDFKETARFYFNHLPRLTTRTKHIKQLRQTILNFAVCGKLVPQNPNEKPARKFMVGAESDNGDRLALRLPEGWSWARVEDVAEARLGKMLDKAKNSGQSYRYLRNTNVHWFHVRMDELKYLRIEKTEIDKYLLREGDVLICEGGHGIGRTAVWREKESDIAFQKALHRVRPGPALSSDFFAFSMFVYFQVGLLQTYFTGAGIPHFTGRALSKLVFPLPPLAEQHRIVAKVNELMVLCDELEAQITTTATTRLQLLEATLHEALSIGQVV